MRSYAIAFLGFGNVAKALVRLLESRRSELASRYGFRYTITGVATRTLGWRANAGGLTPNASPLDGTTCYDIGDWLLTARPDVVFESIALDPHTGQPALDYLSEALRAGAHVVSANKGPVVHGYRELSALAESRARLYRFEAAVMDGAPVFSLVRRCLPLAGIRAVSGVFTSTATVVLEAIERGASTEDGIAEAQALGITEADPSYDVDGWDSVMKVCAVSRVILKTPLLPGAVRREGIRGLEPRTLQAARAEGKPYKLLTRATVNADGSVNAVVRPEQIAVTDPLGNVRGTSLAIHFELDTIPGLTIVSHRPNLQSTAYGLLADFINAVRK